MIAIELIVVCLAIGVLLRLSGRLPDTAPKALGGWVINVALPATALGAVHNVTIHTDWLLAAATPWLGVLLAMALIIPLARAMHWSRQRLGALLLVAGWGNTSFVGLPMVTAYAGAQWAGLVLVIDLFGSYLALSVLGIGIATACSTTSFRWSTVFKRIVTFPPFIAIVIALATNHLERPEWITDLLDSLSATLTPLALAAVGYAIRLDRIVGRLGPLVAGLGYRLAVAPLALLGLSVAMGMTGDPVVRIAIFEMAMPPMLGASIIAIDHDLEPDLVALMIGIGIPLSVVTAPLWWWLSGVV